MNKKAMAALSLGMAMCMGIAFAGCGEKTGTDNKPTIEEVQNAVSEQVTAEEWNAAFSLENFKNCKMTVIMEGKSEDTNIAHRFTITEANNLGFVEYEQSVLMDGQIVEAFTQGYYKVENDQKIYYTKSDNGAWVENSSPNMYLSKYELEESIEKL